MDQAHDRSDSSIAFFGDSFDGIGLEFIFRELTDQLLHIIQVEFFEFHSLDNPVIEPGEPFYFLIDPLFSDEDHRAVTYIVNVSQCFEDGDLLVVAILEKSIELVEDDRSGLRDEGFLDLIDQFLRSPGRLYPELADQLS